MYKWFLGEKSPNVRAVYVVYAPKDLAIKMINKITSKQILIDFGQNQRGPITPGKKIAVVNRLKELGVTKQEAITELVESPLAMDAKAIKLVIERVY